MILYFLILILDTNPCISTQGPVARDLSRDFKERWVCSYPKLSVLLTTSSRQPVEQHPQSVIEDGDGWTVQVLRSSDSDSCAFPADPERTRRLTDVGDRHVDTSLHDCLVRRVRQARSFVYLETQHLSAQSNSLIPKGVTFFKSCFSP